MNRRLQTDENPVLADFLTPVQAAPACGAIALPAERAIVLSEIIPAGTFQKKNGVRSTGKREQALTRDAQFIIRRNGEYHVIAESYFYKTEPYYTILSLEYEGKQVKPASSAVLDAYVTPICLERAKAGGVPVCEWGISQAYVPLPAILYGLSYYATNADYAVVKDQVAAKDRIRHITNNGKYPFCFQKFPEGAEVLECTAIFGKTCNADGSIASHASILYEIFGLPLVKMVFVNDAGSYSLSSLSPLRYSQLTEQERAILCAHISAQESL